MDRQGMRSMEKWDGEKETLSIRRPIIRTLLQTAQAREDEFKRCYRG